MGFEKVPSTENLAKQNQERNEEPTENSEKIENILETLKKLRQQHETGQQKYSDWQKAAVELGEDLKKFYWKEGLTPDENNKRSLDAARLLLLFNKDGQVNNKKIAEFMAYAEKPYQEGTKRGLFKGGVKKGEKLAENIGEIIETFENFNVEERKGGIRVERQGRKGFDLSGRFINIESNGHKLEIGFYMGSKFIDYDKIPVMRYTIVKIDGEKLEDNQKKRIFKKFKSLIDVEAENWRQDIYKKRKEEAEEKAEKNKKVEKFV